MAQNQLLNQNQMQALKSRVLMHDFEKINSVMAGRSVACKIAEGANYGQPPAWSQYRTVNGRPAHEVNFAGNSNFDVTTVEGVIAATGLNYHELAHVLYTQGAAHPHFNYSNLPSHRLRSSTSGRGRIEIVRSIFEDMRIERKFIAEYGPTKPYFQSTIGRYLLRNLSDEQKKTQYLLLAARRYVDKQVRDAYRELCVEELGEEVVKAYTTLANQFADLDMATTKDYKEGFRLVEKAAAILSPESVNNAAKDSPFHGGTENTYPQNRTAGEGPDSDAAAQTRTEKDDPEEREREAEDVNGSGSGEGDQTEEESEDSASGGGDDTDTGDGDDEGVESDSGDGDDEATDGEGTGTDGDGDAEGDSESDGAGTNEGGASGGGSEGGLGTGQGEEGMEEAVEDMIRRSENDETVLTEVANKQRALRSLDRPGQMLTMGMRGGRGYLADVDPEMVLVAKRVAAEFRQLQVDLDPGHKSHQSSGRVSMKRAMKGVDYDTVFDSWDEGQQDATDMEIVILADLSGSMSMSQRRSSEALWTIQRAVEQASSSSAVSLIGYGSKGGYLRKRGERVASTKFAIHPCTDSTTSPSDALQEALALFATTKRSKRVLITLTDGIWDDVTTSDDIIKRMNDAGVVTSVFMFMPGGFMGGSVAAMSPTNRQELFGHNARIYQESTNLTDLIAFAKQVVTTAMKEN